MARRNRTLVCACVALLICGVVPATSTGDEVTEDERTARSLATMLRAALTVVSNNQALINDEKLGDKGLTADRVLGDAVVIYRDQTGVDPSSIDPQSRHGRLLRAQMDAIRKVMNDTQPIINRPGIGFKGIIPSAFARMVNDEFQERMGAEAEVKVTAPPVLIRNRKARPDSWESEMIATRLLQPDWPKGQSLQALAPNRGRESFRFLIPEYYAASCLACHGSPKGEIDITGYPKEGGKEGDLGGVISISIRRQ
jgi:Protein of unknown function (DUF3365)